MDVLEKSSELLLEKEKVTREEFEALFDNGSGTDDDGGLWEQQLHSKYAQIFE